MAIHLFTGDDETLLANAMNELVHQLVGDGDRSLMVDDFDGEDYELRLVVDAAQTAPFLTEKRIVIARGVGRFNADDVSGLVRYLADPLPSTELILSGGGGRLAKSLTDAIKAAGGHVAATGAPTQKKDRSVWIEEQIAAAGLRLDGGAMALVNDWLGEEAGRLQSTLETLVSTFGTGGRLSASDIAPFLGDRGGVPPWDLTDAMDRGDASQSLQLLKRMMGSGERHPLQVMAVLHGHYSKLMKLDGSDARSESDAQTVLGVKSGFQARKSLDQYRKLGANGVGRAMQLMAQADLDLRGEKDWPPELVMEILVARLARLTPGGGARRR
jgi:DNA polymerase III subunit delta